MWRDDNDKIEELYSNIRNIKKFPAMCPICNKNDAHIYMQIYENKTSRGGMWIWCSKCYTFSHGSLRVPEYWENCPLVENEKLYVRPTYLNEMKEVIDAHVNFVRNNHTSKERY